MIICVPNILTAVELDVILKELERAPFLSGTGTAGWSAREVKQNQELDFNSESQAQLGGLVRGALQRSSLLLAAMLPSAMTRVVFNRYEVGMQYGPHVDAAVMGTSGRVVRSDIAITLFLSAPESYVGGELAVINNNVGNEFKLEAGSAIAYPANTLHHVKPVTKGVRQAGIIWVQSQVRDPAKREILWDLDNAKRSVFGNEGKSSAFDALSKSHANLLRMWIDA